MEFTKDVLYVGKWHPPGREPVEFKPDDLAHYARRVKDMLAAGLQIPLSWEHQDEAKPMTEADRKAAKAKHTLGWAKQAELHPDGYLTVVTEVPNEEDGKKLPAVRFISPEIVHDWKDGTGKVWPGPSITHLAVTPRPVQHKQQPFQKLGFSALRLSLADLRLAEDDNYDGKDTGQANDQNSQNGESKPKPAGHLGNLIKELTDVGLVLPADTTPDNLIERLMTAVMTMKAAKKEAKEDEEPYPGTQPPQEAKQTMQMSMEERVKATEARLLGMETAGLRDRIEALFTTGRVSKPIRDKLLEDLGKQQLRLSATGDLEPNPVVYRVESYEALEAGAAFPTRLSHEGGVREVPPPPGTWGAPQTQKEVDDQVSAFFEMIPGGSGK